MDIDNLRLNIDKIDREILDLLNRRYEYVHEIGKWKKNVSHEIYVPEREKVLLSRLEKLNKGPLQTKALRAIYREIMSGALALEHPLTIAYPVDNHLIAKYATLGKFGKNVDTLSCFTIKDVFKEVEAERVNYGVVPIEHSLDGVVNATLDELIHSSSISICAEINVKAHYALISRCRNVEDIKCIYTTENLFRTCSIWLNNNLQEADRKFFDTTDNAYKAMLKEKDSALIGNSLYVTECGAVRSIFENIEDNSNNITRFLVIGKQYPKPTGDDKTSLCYLVEDRAGALCDALLPFRDKNIQITMLESRPSKKKNWEYYFLLDYLAHQNNEDFTAALNVLKTLCPSVKVLGSYPRSNDIL